MSDDRLRIWISRPVFVSYHEEIGYHKAASEDFKQENVEEQSVDKVKFSSQQQ